jgi:hypothetical protein
MMPADRTIRVRAEDVLNEPRVHLRRVAEWLGVRTDSHAIEAMMHPEASPFARFAAKGSGVVGGFDHEFLRDPRPRRTELPSEVRLPEQLSADAALWSCVASVSHELGYRVVSHPRSSR